MIIVATVQEMTWKCNDPSKCNVPWECSDPLALQKMNVTPVVTNQHLRYITFAAVLHTFPSQICKL